MIHMAIEESLREGRGIKGEEPALRDATDLENKGDVEGKVAREAGHEADRTRNLKVGMEGHVFSGGRLKKFLLKKAADVRQEGDKVKLERSHPKIVGAFKDGEIQPGECGKARSRKRRDVEGEGLEEEVTAGVLAGEIQEAGDQKDWDEDGEEIEGRSGAGRPRRDGHCRELKEKDDQVRK